MSHLGTINDERLARVAVEIRGMRAAADEDGRGYTSDEQEKYGRMVEEYSGLEGKVMASSSVPRQVYPVNESLADFRVYSQRKMARQQEHRNHCDAFSNFLRNGLGDIDGDEKKLLLSFRGDDTPAGVPVPVSAESRRIRAAQTNTTTGGGYLDKREFSDLLEEALQFHAGILGVVSSFTTKTGAPLDYPSVNDTSNQGRIIAVNTQATETDLVFGLVQYGTSYIFCSDFILVPTALIEDSYFDLDAHVAELLGKRIGRLMNKKFTVGTGSGEPLGIQPAVVAAGNTVQGPTGETTSVSYDSLVNLVEAVDEAYGSLPTAGFMLSASTRKAIRLLKDTAGRPLWQPAGPGVGEPATILDKPLYINNDMPAMAANAYPILFGDLSRYRVRRIASGTTVLRLGERWGDFLQVGYLGFSRADAQLTDAGTHPVAAYQNSAS